MVNCFKCGSSNVQSRGYNQNRDKKRFECQEDHSKYVDENDNDYRWFSLPIEMTVEKSKNAPKILIWDVETHIDKAWLFSHGKQYVHGTSFENEVSLICWSAKWLGSPETLVMFKHLRKQRIKTTNGWSQLFGKQYLKQIFISLITVSVLTNSL